MSSYAAEKPSMAGTSSRPVRKAPQKLSDDEKPNFLLLKPDAKPLTCSICMLQKKKVSCSTAPS